MIGAAEQTRKAALRTGEIALLVALAGLAAVAWANPASVPLATRSSLVTVAVLFGVAAAALGEGQEGWRYWFRELLPVPVVPFVYLNLGRLIPLVNGNVYDAQLEALDRRLLGPETQAALYALPLPAWLADLLTVAYSTFFFLPIVLLVALASRRDPLTARVVSAIILTFLVSYAGYFVIPAYGPRVTVAQERYATLPAGLVGAPMRDALDHWEKTKTDAFPSGHTMVTLAVLLIARRRARDLYNIILPVGALLIAATVLLTYHYVVDVLAAPPLLAAALALARLIDGRVPATSPAAQGAPPPERST
jgi:membrane-associated phospholipid phosphatase